LPVHQIFISSHAIFNTQAQRYRVSVRTLLSARLLDLTRYPNPDQPVVWLELLQRFRRVVDEGEASALATTILRPKAENCNLILACLVEFGQL